MNGEWMELRGMHDVSVAQQNGWEIEVNVDDSGWCVWSKCLWRDAYKFRARPAQPKMKKIKMECWLTGNVLRWAIAGEPSHESWIRIPTEDKEIEVPE